MSLIDRVQPLKPITQREVADALAERRRDAIDEQLDAMRREIEERLAELVRRIEALEDKP